MRLLSVAVIFITILVTTTATLAGDPPRARPFVLAESAPGSLPDKITAVRSSLESAGFKVTGEYAPYSGAHLLLITDDRLHKQAAASKFGGYGAAIRVSVTENEDTIQVSYTNPLWMGNVYRMSGDFGSTAAKLKSALGWLQDFGSSGGRTLSSLREYHYMVFMPYFDDQVLLAEHDSHKAALSAVESGLAAGKGGVSKVSRIDITGKEEVLFNIAIKEGVGADKAIMPIIDQTKMRHTAHLPYELLVVGKKVYMLHGKFRIAQSFPDLTMTSFMKISDAPDAIETALKSAAGGK